VCVCVCVCVREREREREREGEREGGGERERERGRETWGMLFEGAQAVELTPSTLASCSYPVSRFCSYLLCRSTAGHCTLAKAEGDLDPPDLG
jgi:hypothetical protein